MVRSFSAKGTLDRSPRLRQTIFCKDQLERVLGAFGIAPQRDGILIVLVDLRQEIKRMLYDRAVALKRYPAVLLVDHNLIRPDLLQIVEPGIARRLDRDDASVFVDDRGHQLRSLALDVSGKDVIDGLLERIVAGHRRDNPHR